MLQYVVAGPRDAEQAVPARPAQARVSSRSCELGASFNIGGATTTIGLAAARVAHAERQRENAVPPAMFQGRSQVASVISRARAALLLPVLVATTSFCPTMPAAARAGVEPRCWQTSPPEAVRIVGHIAHRVTGLCLAVWVGGGAGGRRTTMAGETFGRRTDDVANDTLAEATVRCEA